MDKPRYKKGDVVEFITEDGIIAVFKILNSPRKALVEGIYPNFHKLKCVYTTAVKGTTRHNFWTKTNKFRIKEIDEKTKHCDNKAIRSLYG